MRRRLRLPSPAMIVSMIALIAALGGTAYAQGLIGGGQIRNNSVTGADIKNRSVRGLEIKNQTIQTRDIGRGGVAGSEVRDGSLQAGDFAPGQLPAGAQGPKGDVGPAGPQRYVLVNAAGEIERQSGGFRIVSAYGSNGAAAGAAGNVYIELANEDLSDNGLLASISLQNQANQNGSANGSNGTDGAPGTATGTNTNGDGTPPTEGDNLEFSGEISVAKCNTAGIVACQPPGANENDTLVVSPRLSDGQRTTAGNRKRFFVVVTG